MTERRFAPPPIPEKLVNGKGEHMQKEMMPPKPKPTTFKEFPHDGAVPAMLDVAGSGVATGVTALSPNDLLNAADAHAGPPRAVGLPTTSADRKEFPIASGVVEYFPDALAEVAHISWVGNQKHNPGEPLHHARGKSMDHHDCIARHLLQRGQWEWVEWTQDNRVHGRWVKHSAALAWRALAALQEECEREGAPLAPGARNAS